MLYTLCAPLRISCRNQIIWGIPEELIKRVSQARFITTMGLEHGFVNQKYLNLHCGKVRVTNYEPPQTLIIDAAALGGGVSRSSPVEQKV
jgi:hypothetical protein